MTDLIFSDSRMETMEGFYPGRKPVGNVKIDWEHPLAEGLREVHLCTQAHSIDLVSHTARHQRTNSGSLTDNVGGGLKFTSNGGAVPVDNKEVIELPQCGDLPSGSVTVVIDDDTASRLLGVSYFYTHNDHTNDHRLYLGVSQAGVLQVRLGAGTLTDITAIIGKTVISIAWSGTTADVCVNSLFYTYSFTGVPGSFGGVEIETLLGGYRDPNSTTEVKLGWSGIMYHLAQRNTRMTKTEMLSIDRSPYQFLIPAG